MRDIERAKDVGFHRYIFGHFHTPFDSEFMLVVDRFLAQMHMIIGTEDTQDHLKWHGWYTQKNGEFNRINFKLRLIMEETY